MKEHVARHRGEPSPEGCGRAGSVPNERFSKYTLDDGTHRFWNATELPLYNPAIEVNSPNVFLKTAKSTINPIKIIVVADEGGQGRELRKRSLKLKQR